MSDFQTALYGEYRPLQCQLCGRDVLKTGGVLHATEAKQDDGSIKFTRILVCCEGECEEELAGNLGVSFGEGDDISILASPLGYVVNLVCLSRHQDAYTEEARQQFAYVLTVAAQAAMRTLTEEEANMFQSMVSRGWASHVYDLLESDVMESGN